MSDQTPQAEASADITPLCARTTDFWSPPARAAMARFLAPFLSEIGATPLELLHSPAHQKAFEAHAIRRTVCDRAARVQATAHGLSVMTRAQELEALVKQAGSESRQQVKAAAPSPIAAGAYGASAARFLTEAKNDQARAVFALNAAITLTLTGCKTRQAKVELLLDWLESLGGEPTNEAEALALEQADAFLGETLAAPGVLRGLAHHADNLRDVAETIIDLYQGRAPEGVLLATTLRRLLARLQASALPETRDGMIRALQDDLEGDERLIPSVSGDLVGQHTLLADLMATASLIKRLKQPSGFIGGRHTHDVLDRRVALMVSTEKLQELLRGRSMLDKLRDLFHLQHALSVASSTRTIDDYILALMESRDFIGRLGDSAETSEARLRALAEIQGLVLDSGFPAAKRKELAKALDAAQRDMLKTLPHLSVLRKTARPSIEAVLTVVDLAGDRAFTRGHCMTEARELIRRHIRHKDFVRKYLKSLNSGAGRSAASPGAEPSNETAARLAELADRIRRAGVEFTDLSQLRILVAEDEESARGYIAMVLKDMGIGNVLTARDGRDAMKMFEDFEDGIDLIICDWKMPRMSGLDFLKQVRSVRPRLPFLMVTALATLENVEEAMQHEVSGYIAKPFPPEQLEEKVLLLISRSTPPQT